MTHHAADCRRVFSRYDDRCPRCQELAAGASARPGWSDRKRDDARRVEAIRRHDCQRSGCGPVCTFGDW